MLKCQNFMTGFRLIFVSTKVSRSTPDGARDHEAQVWLGKIFEILKLVNNQNTKNELLKIEYDLWGDHEATIAFSELGSGGRRWQCSRFADQRSWSIERSSSRAVGSFSPTVPTSPECCQWLLASESSPWDWTGHFMQKKEVSAFSCSFLDNDRIPL